MKSNSNLFLLCFALSGAFLTIDSQLAFIIIILIFKLNSLAQFEFKYLDSK